MSLKRSGWRQCYKEARVMIRRTLPQCYERGKVKCDKKRIEGRRVKNERRSKLV